MAQTSYNFATPKGVAGGLYDLSLHDVNARKNESANGVLKFGMGVIAGTTAGVQVTIPTTSKTAADFEGVLVNGFTTQLDMAGELTINKDAIVGVLEKGRIWVRVIDDLTIAYGDPVYLYLATDDVGCFSNEADATPANTLLIPSARFIGGVNGGIAPIEYDMNAIKACVDAEAYTDAAVE